ncbi:hypothetical protein B0A48_17307 [Cryoendolithus antarcticus]|uniref:Uncharacterized protein n=1 Tax=Cryoendolithus antarcticus TaxID=1507870 RepID=A0A1V8SCB9_9PEZI|nr:hypothetical protein B0A48_17307 [Cryoendolithus antarcticus]
MDFDDYGDDYRGGYEYEAPLNPGGMPYFGSNPTSREWDYEGPRGQGGTGSFGSNCRVSSALSPPIADRAYHRELWMDDRLSEEDGLYECIQEDEMTAGLSRGPALRDENLHLYAYMPQDRVDLKRLTAVHPETAWADYNQGRPYVDSRRRQSSALAGYGQGGFDWGKETAPFSSGRMYGDMDDDTRDMLVLQPGLDEFTSRVGMASSGGGGSLEDLFMDPQDRGQRRLSNFGRFGSRGYGRGLNDEYTLGAGYLLNYDALEGYDCGSMPGTMNPYMGMGPGNPYQDMARSLREAHEDETLGGRIYDRWDPPSGVSNDYRERAGRGNLGTNVMGGPPIGPIRDDYDEPELFAPQARRAMPPYMEEDLEVEPYGPYDPRYEAFENDEAPPLFRTGGFAGDPFCRPPTPPTDVWAAAPQLNPRRRPDRSIITSGIRGHSPPRFGRGNSPVPTRRWGSVMNSPSAHSLMSVGRADAYPHYAEPPPRFWDEPEEEEPKPMLTSGLGGGLRALAPRPWIGGGSVGAFGNYDVGEFDGWTAFHGR